MQRVQAAEEKSFDEEKDTYVLSWKSSHKIMHCIIKIDKATYKINQKKFSSFPALIEGYMRKPEDDVYHLTRALQNPKTKKSVKNRHSRIDNPESLSWYHGTVGNKVSFCHFFIIISFISLSKRTSELLSREPAGKYLLRKNDEGLFRLSYKSDQRKVFFNIIISYFNFS